MLISSINKYFIFQILAKIQNNNLKNQNKTDTVLLSLKEIKYLLQNEYFS